MNKLAFIIAFFFSNTVVLASDRALSSCLEYDPSCSVQARLHTCASVPYVSDKEVKKCLDDATAPAPASAMDNGTGGAFFGAVDAYLTTLIENRIQSTIHDGSTTVSQYHAWKVNKESSCEANTQSSPDGSSYGYEVEYCISNSDLSILQKHLQK